MRADKNLQFLLALRAGVMSHIGQGVYNNKEKVIQSPIGSLLGKRILAAHAVNTSTYEGGRAMI